MSFFFLILFSILILLLTYHWAHKHKTQQDTLFNNHTQQLNFNFMQMRSDFRERQPIGKKPFSGAQLPSPSRVQCRQDRRVRGRFHCFIWFDCNHMDIIKWCMEKKLSTVSVSLIHTFSSSVVILWCKFKFNTAAVYFTVSPALCWLLGTRKSIICQIRMTF